MSIRYRFLSCVLSLLLLPGVVRAQEAAKLTASDGASSDLFGQAVALSGDGQTALVGAWQHDDPSFLTGAAYVFARDGSMWTEQAELNASDAATGDEFGFQDAVAISGDGQTALVGASGNDDTFFLSGSAYVFVRNGSAWSEEQKLVADDPDETAFFGSSVALSADGTVALIGARLDGATGDMTGSAYIFTRNDPSLCNGPLWCQEAKLTASDAADGDWFGGDVALSGNGQYALVSAQADDGGTGSAYVFVRSGSTWSEQAKLTASDAAADDFFGKEVALSDDGQYAVVGAYLDDVSGTDAGSVYVFVRTGTAWSEQAKLTPGDGGAGDQFGYSVAVNGDGTVVLAGANAEDEGGSDAGSAYVFIRSGATWSEDRKLTASDAAALDFFGRAVSLDTDGQTALVGADGDDDNGPDSGSAYVFELSPATSADAPASPDALRLSPAAPNPFRHRTSLVLTLAEAQPVTVAVYDVLGRRVAVLHEGPTSAGTPLDLVWRAEDAAPGLYVVRAEGATFRATQRVVRVR